MKARSYPALPGLFLIWTLLCPSELAVRYLSIWGCGSRWEPQHEIRSDRASQRFDHSDTSVRRGRPGMPDDIEHEDTELGRVEGLEAAAEVLKGADAALAASLATG